MALNPYGQNEKQLYDKLYSFRFATEEEAKELGSKMTARYIWGKKVKENMGADKAIPLNSDLTVQLLNEKAMYEQFYGYIYHLMSLYAPVQMQRDTPDGPWYYEGTPTFMMQFSQAGVASSEKGIKPANHPINRICFKNNNGKYTFVDAKGSPRFLEEDEMEVAKNEQRFVKNMEFLLEDIAKEDEDYMKKYLAAGAFSVGISGAIEGNSLDNLEFMPMPKAGSLNASLKSKALAIAKKRNKDVVDVVITRDNWDVKYNALGQPIHRVAYGYYIVKTEHGKRAISHSWAQDHQGGGKYGELRHFGVGVGDEFYVK